MIFENFISYHRRKISAPDIAFKLFEYLTFPPWNPAKNGFDKLQSFIESYLRPKDGPQQSKLKF